MPVVTQDFTLSIEDIIKKRIKEESWDDVIRKIPPDSKKFKPKKVVELDQEKSKIGLAEIYEQEVTYFIFFKKISKFNLSFSFFKKVFKTNW